jgi:mannitol/fructose-specific phosphotransferase system IIA component (Ntr-type)
MLSILEAVWQGRTIDLPVDKEYSLVQLAHEIGAVALEDGEKIAEEILARERGHNCSIGFGVATPHIGVPGKGELVCAVGWSKEGLDYGACNGQPVHMLIMYRIPESRRSAYLDEMAAISRAIKTLGEKPINNEKDRTKFINALIEQTQDARSAAARPEPGFHPSTKAVVKGKRK